ncbi:hypothetical protein XA68_11314 [Ophiocordyceps unilateralis]|uniref:Peptidase A1 domain-containing protein n=1 Tax=Ophiocordyceps unilateralis TaxID=268505 RepID=A0A2A9PFV6_OPHUN|nr:hypothetical protein XA68_11314 [Ophiocordyceps unilateralis]
MTIRSLATCSTFLLLLLLRAVLVAAPEPKAARWHSRPIGPDGPWNAVEVMMGSRQSPVALFPGHSWATWVITTDYCDLNSSISHCPGGAYPKDKAINRRFANIQFHPGPQGFMYGAVVEGRDADMFQDDFDMSFGSGLIPNVSMTLLDSQMMVYPGGGRYPLFAGCLSLGAENVNQTFTLDGEQSINSTIIPWHLAQNQITASSSFGMHIGSAVQGSSVNGSLLYGGYDRSRAMGKVLEFDGLYSEHVTVKDIGVRVVQGRSPFGFRAKDNLLSAGNTSLASGLPVQLDPCSPYLTLPKSTCDSIVANLPVTYNDPLGLYMWNTNDAKYSDIMNSASVLALTIASRTDSLTINVPFQHLNLTLDPPLVAKSAAYFPCSTGGLGSYVLGKAFFQDAFLSANWEARRWWLAQAPGPGSTSPSNPVDILPTDKTIYSGSSDWASTWNGVWTELANRRGPSSAKTHQGDPDSDTSGLSTGAKVGIGVGAGLGLLALIMGAVFLWRRRKSRQRTAPVDQDAPADDQQQPTMVQASGPVEADGLIPKDYWNSSGHQTPMTAGTGRPRFSEQPMDGEHQQGFGGPIHELDHGIPTRHNCPFSSRQLGVVLPL